MARLLAALLALMQIALPVRLPDALPRLLKSGEWLRFHVIAHDDTPRMQQVKLLVRDAVQAAWQSCAPHNGTMLARTAAVLPELSDAAIAAARQAGFTGPVEVRLGTAAFDDRTLEGMTIPAGDYPALMILLGDAQGQNWWGLIDPEAALQLAAVTDAPADGPIRWDWSFKALLAALFGLPAAEGT